ncbi:MAG: Obg family GTPase CgtA, partial [Candidatus Dormibacteraeota bacterium]|nr:Obg family GTPase CgtA [Candidatus Dormibacteraeota bacterium]
PPAASVTVTPPTIRLRPRRQTAAPPQVERREWGFEVSGAAVDRLVARTDFDSDAALQLFQVGLDRIGVSGALEEAGARPGDNVRIGALEFEYQP